MYGHGPPHGPPPHGPPPHGPPPHGGYDPYGPSDGTIACCCNTF